MQSTEIGEQSTLFPEVDTFTVYEQPLNERMRNCLRLEYLFAAIQNGRDCDTEWHARGAIVGMLEVCDLVTRTDIKGESIKELERQISKISGLKNNPEVDQEALEDILSKVGPLVARLKSNDCHPGAAIRRDELINQVKQRISIPGGACNFDLPAYHYWLSKSQEARTDQLEKWLDDLLVIEQAVAQVLKMLRESSAPRRISAEDGLYQQQLDPAQQCQLIRLSVNDNLAVFPEISGGKHRFVVRFFRQTDTSGRPTQARETLSFNLQCCGI